MKIKEKKQIKLTFPFGLYLKQLFSPDIYVKFINPFGFWRRYKINQLETCLEINTVQRLEDCHKKEWQPFPFDQENRTIKNSNQTEIYRRLPGKKIPQNTILISQPNFELKYRGVTYHNSGIFIVNINKVKVNLNQINPSDNSGIFFTTNNSVNSEISSNIWKLK